MSKKAVLIGINDYKYVSDLRGCRNDVEKMHSLLVSQFGFSEKNIKSLVDDQAIKANVLKALEWLATGAVAGDELVFFVAAHGSHQCDVDGDEEDGVDELICLYDMSFDDPGSYLLDDEIYEFTLKIPVGVQLTILFDTCHSGTGTRMLLAPAQRAMPPYKLPLVDIEATQAREERRSQRGASPAKLRSEREIVEPQSTAEMKRTVLARYILPPPRVLERLQNRGVAKNGFRALGSNKRKMNHVFLAAAEASQTAADDFIDDQPQGAFSYHFNKVVRDAGDLDLQVLFKKVRSNMHKAGYAQTPQLEPDNATGLLFGGSKRVTKASEKERENDDVKPDAANLRGEEKTHYLLERILRQLEEYHAAQKATRDTASGLGKRALVYVHGICKHEAGYADSWWEALRGHLPEKLRMQLQNERHEVLWSDLVTPARDVEYSRAPSAILREFEAREEAVEAELQAVIADRALREQLAQQPPQPAEGAPESLTETRGLVEASGVNCIDDFVKYLLRNTVRREVQKRFLDQILPLLENGYEVDVMSHSWGTVVAYEALRGIDLRNDLTGHIRNLFTIGSALSIGSVRRRLETVDLLRPHHVRHWINLDAKRDLVGGPLRPLGYGVDFEFVNLEPVGCTLFSNPWCPHSSYFKINNVAVNRGVFSRYMS